MSKDNKNNKEGEIIKRKVIKITMLGDSSVGKTCLTNVYLGQKFANDFISTIGKNKMETFKEMKDGKKMKINIIDTAGQERFHAIAKTSIKGANGIVVTFDLTNPKTFTNVERWLSDINENNNKLPIVLFGNKCDLEDQRKVTQEQIDEFLEKNNNLPYFETSAKTGVGIKEGYQKVIDDAYEIIKKSQSGGIILENDNGKKKPQKKCCK